MQKATQAIAATQFPGVTVANTATGTGLLLPTTGLVAGDRGCLPAVDGTFASQATTSQLTLATAGGVTNTGLASDYALAIRLLCSTSGTCCTTDLCNTMSRIEMSFVAMFMSIALALFGVFRGF
jgi:hypothetical protein